MSDIPEDIMREANAALAWKGREDDVRFVAMAILSERERCAKIADGTGICSPKFMNNSDATMGKWIAKMIREHPNP